MHASVCTRRVSSRTCRNGALAGSGFSAAAFARSKHSNGGSPVVPCTGVADLTHPARQVSLQRLDAVEAIAGDGVALDVAHLAFVLALGPVSARCARPGAQSPSSG
jgi:hypothetical protein